MVKGRDYRGQVCQFGELVWARDPRPSTQDAKLQLRWVPRVWLGKVLASDEHIVDGGEGVPTAMKTRVVRRRPENERWSKEKLAAVCCFPWTNSEMIAAAAMPSRPHDKMQKVNNII